MSIMKKQSINVSNTTMPPSGWTPKHKLYGIIIDWHTMKMKPKQSQPVLILDSGNNVNLDFSTCCLS